MFDHILLATDFSEHAVNALYMTSAICENNSHRLTVLTVFDPSEELPMEGVFGTSDRAIEQTEKDLRDVTSQKLDDFCKPLDDLGILYQKIVGEGSPDDIIVEKAEELDCDLIVMGSHSKRSILDILLGSTTEAVAQKAKCPVLVATLPKSQSDSIS